MKDDREQWRTDNADPGALPDGWQLRTDRGELGRPVVTAEGFKTFEAFFAQPGILEYPQADGTIRRELVPASTLHDPASLETIKRKPVTNEHPKQGRVTPDNVKALAVGDVGAEIEIDEDTGLVKLMLTVRDRGALDAVERKTLQEVSPGYAVKIDDTPGTDPVFGDYDAIQTHRSYNHVALTAAGRGGAVVRLRADSKGNNMNPKQIRALVAALIASGIDRTDAEDIGEQAADKTDTEGRIKALEDALGALMKKDQLAEEEPPADEEPPAEDNADELGSDEDEAEDKQDSRHAYFVERSKLVDAATALRLDSGDKPVNVAKTSNAALRKFVVLADNPNARADAAPDYYRAAFDMRADSIGDRSGTAWGAFTRADSKTGKKVDDRDDSKPASQGWLDTINKQFNARRA